MTHRDDDDISVEMITSEPEVKSNLNDFRDGLSVVLRGGPSKVRYDAPHSIAKL